MTNDEVVQEAAFAEAAKRWPDASTNPEEGMKRSAFMAGVRFVLARSDEPTADLAHLDAVQLRRIVDRHIRWRTDALRLLEQVNKGYEGEWPEIAEFVRNSTTRPVLSTPENRGGE